MSPGVTFFEFSDTVNDSNYEAPIRTNEWTMSQATKTESKPRQYSMYQVESFGYPEH